MYDLRSWYDNTIPNAAETILTPLDRIKIDPGQKLKGLAIIGADTQYGTFFEPNMGRDPVITQGLTNTNKTYRKGWNILDKAMDLKEDNNITFKGFQDSGIASLVSACAILQSSPIVKLVGEGKKRHSFGPVTLNTPAAGVWNSNNDFFSTAASRDLNGKQKYGITKILGYGSGLIAIRLFGDAFGAYKPGGYGGTDVGQPWMNFEEQGDIPSFMGSQAIDLQTLNFNTTAPKVQVEIVEL